MIVYVFDVLMFILRLINVVLLCVIFQVYGEYRASLAFDLVSSRQKNVSEISSDICCVSTQLILKTFEVPKHI